MRIEITVKCQSLLGLREVGDVVDTSDAMAQMLISAGYAKPYMVVQKTEEVTKKAKRKASGK